MPDRPAEPNELAELRSRLAEIHDLRRAQEVLFWDQTVMMPPGGGPVRGAQLTTIDRIAHERFVVPEVGRLLDGLASYEESLDYDSDDASLIRTSRRDWEKARRVPADLAAEMVGAAAEAHDIWAKAREENDFASFLPHLERAVELKRRYIDCFEGYAEPYDVLLDDYEPGMKTAEVRAVFDELKASLVPLIAEVASSDEDDGFMRGPFPIDAQHETSLRVIERFGYDPQYFRLDLTVHPFAASSGTQDIRLTTRYTDNDLTSLFTAMHECGHGLYEHGISQTLERTPLCSGVSSALHESQSRLWENIVGRSRPFWNYFYPQVQAAFPDTLRDVEQDAFYRAINRVKPSYIRVDADEATYNLHVILRFELEQELIAGTIALADLPEAWNARFEQYLGIPIPSDTVGVLQDVHWSGGGFGYFPTYTLGNIVSVQIWDKVASELPDLPAQFEAGEFGELHAWLRSNLYVLGRKFTPQETLERVVGGQIDAKPYVRYLTEKLGALAAA
ncbi:MAG: carboxypeptidase M32 [Gaiellaceae bacterium MAG52_C11]|nr:carboxypeptidase M32 [Candidatus Gaiellasilicea maunaloa]